MKVNHCLFVVILALGLFACSKSDIEYENSFQKSEKALSTFKASNNNSYLFEVTGGTWVGYSWKTSIKVTNGVAVERKFTYTGFDNIIKPSAGWDAESISAILVAMQITAAEYEANAGEKLSETLDWVETGAAIGSHKNSPASAFLTLDEIYSTAKNDWLKKKPNVETYFETKNNGMISNCGYVENGCMDDCFRGISISLIQPL